MASVVTSLLGGYSDFFAAAGAVTVSYLALKLIFAFLRAVRNYALAGALGLSTNLKKCGEWAVVTGSTDGIGKAYAQQLAKQGLNIVLISRTEAKLKTVASEIETAYKVKTKIIAADFTRSDIYDKIKQGLQGIDIGVLVNNVGLSYNFPEYFLEVEERDQHFIDLLNVNCTSMTLMSSIVMPGMVDRRRGTVINVASASGLVPTPLLSVYSACKSYVVFLSECLESEYKPKGITVQCVAPFFVVSNMSKLRKASLTIPMPSTFVKSALNLVGLEVTTTGYWGHAMLNQAAVLFPGLAAYVANNVFLASRKRGLRKLTPKGGKAQ